VLDVILGNSSGSTIGVQIKRTRLPIEVEQIRSLAGALVLGDHTQGVFVTTSRFRRGAAVAALAFESKGIPIQLIDASGFLEALRITQVSAYTSYEDWENEVGDIELETVYQDESAE
jgi:restriction system protein